MVYYTDLDGRNTEGLGAVLQLYLHLFAYSMIYKKPIELLDFKNLSHYQHEKKTKKEFHQNLNSFLPFNNGQLRNENSSFIDPKFLLLFFGEIFIRSKRKHIRALAKKVNYSSDVYFNSYKTISIHIRNLNKLDTDLIEGREYLGKKKHIYYINLLNYLIKKHQGYEIHIFSQGNIKDFKFLSDFKINLHLNTPLIETFYHLMNSNILVAANSSLSWTAHLMGKHYKVYARPTFFHSWYLGTTLLSERGKPINKFTSYLMIQSKRFKTIIRYYLKSKILKKIE